MENKILLLQNKLWNCTGILSFCFYLLAYTREHNPCECDKRENFDRNLIAIFLLKTSKGFFLLSGMDFHSHESCVKLRPRNLSTEKNFLRNRRCAWMRVSNRKFHDGSHFGTLIWGLNKVMQARNYLDYNWEALGYPLLTELFSWTRLVIEDDSFKYVESFQIASVE